MEPQHIYVHYKQVPRDTSHHVDHAGGENMQARDQAVDEGISGVSRLSGTSTPASVNQRQAGPQDQHNQDWQSYETRLPDSAETSQSTLSVEANINTQPQPKPYLGQLKKFSDFLGDWRWECGAAFVAAGILVAQFVILSVYQDRKTSDWTGPIALNTLIAVLSTISRVSLVSITSEIISQLQWTRSATAAPLSDLKAYNQASRGAWASLKLLILGSESWKRPDLSVALSVVLISLGMGAFAQQAVQTVECTVLGERGTASIPSVRTVGRVGRYNASIPDGKVLIDDDVSGLRLAAKAGILLSLFDPFGNYSTLVPTCTGNCTFSSARDVNGDLFSHRSIGFCSQCIDTSSRVARDDQRVTPLDGFAPMYRNGAVYQSMWSLPSGLSVTALQTLEVPDKTAPVNRPGRLEHCVMCTNETSDATFLNITTDDPPDRLSWRSNASDTADFLGATRYAIAIVDILSIDEHQSPGARRTRDEYEKLLGVRDKMCPLSMPKNIPRGGQRARGGRDPGLERKAQRVQELMEFLRPGTARKIPYLPYPYAPGRPDPQPSPVSSCRSDIYRREHLARSGRRHAHEMESCQQGAVQCAVRQGPRRVQLRPQRDKPGEHHRAARVSLGRGPQQLVHLGGRPAQSCPRWGM